MEAQQRFEIRCMNPNEVDRVGELVRALQRYQKMKVVSRLPCTEDCVRDLTHEAAGSRVPNNKGTFTVVAIDTSKLNASDKSYIVGYLIYSQSFSIINGRNIYMNSFFIEEEYRGHGLGRKIMDFMRLHATATGNSIVHVPVMNDNTIGQKFYESYGAYIVSDEYLMYAKNLDDKFL